MTDGEKRHGKNTAEEHRKCEEAERVVREGLSAKLCQRGVEPASRVGG